MLRMIETGECAIGPEVDKYLRQSQKHRGSNDRRNSRRNRRRDNNRMSDEMQPNQKVVIVNARQTRR